MTVDPANGTYWYYSDPTDVDIMIQNNGTWQGYIHGCLQRGKTRARAGISNVTGWHIREVSSATDAVL